MDFQKSLPLIICYYRMYWPKFSGKKVRNPTVRAYRKAGYLTMVIAGYIPANSQLAAAIATIVKSLSVGK